tara:strand:- start:1086 stop:1358 length:273 start_codon:yes stop_codon:yes gene_type:complete
MGKRKANNSPPSSIPSSLGNLFNNFFNFKIGNTTIPRQPAKKKSRTSMITNNKNETIKKLTFNNTTNVPNTFKKLLEKNEKNEKARKNKK